MLCMSLQHLHLLYRATCWQILLHMAAVVWVNPSTPDSHSTVGLTCSSSSAKGAAT